MEIQYYHCLDLRNDNPIFIMLINDLSKSAEYSNIIMDSVINSLHHTMKSTMTCELTGNTYNSNEIQMFRLRSATDINPHHCYGTLFYHHENQKYCDDANIYFECYKEIIQDHSLQNLEILIERSDGTITKGFIKPDTPIIYWKDKLCLAINVYFIENEEEKYKTIGLRDYHSKSKNKYIRGLFTVNPTIMENSLKIKIKKGNSLFSTYQEIWRIKIKDWLNNEDILHEFNRE